ncbi:GatB/YqeY domain-containing protein [Marinivivus vitaminiproducens]|uniref:GatB/YqeY domain-containing protein n=1 Tax=Marinivivus vitaminiproducens TaxID=3035935 RepID=UPI0027A804C6|nr:GatB/YqeY domain-containing protein [Geminicoccaceae bacterium SCSIO 64248]
MIRDALTSAFKTAGAGDDEHVLGMLRLLQTALRERDTAARAHGHPEGLSETELEAMLRDMVSQRRNHIERCECSARLAEAEQEQAEIDLIEGLLPPIVDDTTIERMVEQCIDETGAAKLKDTGKVISRLKERCPGSFDPVKVRRLLCTRLT